MNLCVRARACPWGEAEESETHSVLGEEAEESEAHSVLGEEAK